jgi:hypothetical protein
MEETGTQTVKRIPNSGRSFNPDPADKSHPCAAPVPGGAHRIRRPFLQRRPRGLFRNATGRPPCIRARILMKGYIRPAACQETPVAILRLVRPVTAGSICLGEKGRALGVSLRFARPGNHVLARSGLTRPAQKTGRATDRPHLPGFPDRPAPLRVRHRRALASSSL